ncbi:MAG: SPOR domain-containing protein [Pseudomonadota bacterium]
MSLDLKPRKMSHRKKAGGGTLLGLFIGLVVGVLTAALVVWYINKMPTPFMNKEQEPVVPATAKLPEATQPALLPGKPGDPIPQGADKPRFDFYKILPGNAEGMPSPAPEEKSAEASKADKENTLKEPLYLQIGSFQNAADAENQKAKLAFVGFEAAVQQIMLQDKIWFRVRLGPFQRMDETNRVRADLAKQGFDANVVKKD